MAARKPKALGFAEQVRAAAAQAPVQELGEAIGNAALLRRRNRAVRQIQSTLSRYNAPSSPASGSGGSALPSGSYSPAARRAQRRVGRNRRYAVLSKPNMARFGTWRHHMVKTIREHNSVWEATAANADCGIDKFASQRLDFNWAADNGYISWEA